MTTGNAIFTYSKRQRNVNTFFFFFVVGFDKEKQP